jgi:hypothetical protein
MKARAIGMVGMVFMLAACDDMPPRAAVAPPGAFALAEGKSFYLFRPGFRCGGPTPEAPPVPSWVDRIEVHNGHLVRWGSRCGGEGLPLPADERAAARLSHDGTRLIVAGKVYRLSADDRHEAEQRP